MKRFLCFDKDLAVMEMSFIGSSFISFHSCVCSELTKRFSLFI